MIEIVLTLVVLGLAYLGFKNFNEKKQEKLREQQRKEAESKKQSQSKDKKPKTEQKPQVSIKQLQKQVKNIKQKKHKIQHKQITHPLYMNCFSEFAGNITDYSISGNYIGIASEDKTVKIVDIFSIKEENMKYNVLQFDFDYATAINISQNQEYIAVAMHAEKTVKVYSYDPKNANKKYIKLLHTLPLNIHKEDIIKINISDNNKYLTTIAGGKDIDVKVWDLWTQELVHTQHTALGQHFQGSFSNSLVLVAGWVSNLLVYKFICDQKSKLFERTTKIFSLTHEKSLLYSNVSSNEERAFSICKDNSLKIWNINVDYRFQEEAKVLKQYKAEDIQKIFGSSKEQIIAAHGAFSEVTRKWVYTIATQNQVILLNEQFEEVQRINDILAEDCSIDDISFMHINKAFVLVVLSKSEHRVSIFKINALFK